MSRFVLWALLLGLLSFTVQAAYVTDQLLAGLYDRPDAGGEPRLLLKSGTPLEVISTDGGFSRVRLADGSEGWLEASYLTEERPARHRVLMLQARVSDLERAAETDATPAVETLQDEQLRQLAGALQQAHQQIAVLNSKHPSETYRRTWPWVLGALALLVGFAAGVGLVEYRLRRSRR